MTGPTQPGGLFAPGQVDPAAQELLLGALDAFVQPEQATACAGPNGDGHITHACLSTALRHAPCGKAPGSDGITYEALKAFWGALAEPLVASCNEAFLDDSPEPMLPVSGPAQWCHYADTSKGVGSPWMRCLHIDPLITLAAEL